MTSGDPRSERGNIPVGFGTPVPEELPGVPDLSDQVEIQIGDDEFLTVPAALRNQTAARIAEVALAVEFANLPGIFNANPVDRTNKVAVRDRVRRLFQLPQ